MARIPFDERNVARISETLHRLTRKRYGLVTLAENADTTTVDNPTVTEDSGIVLIYRTANAATEIHSAPYCLITTERGSFTIEHVNGPETDRTFFWAAVGD